MTEFIRKITVSKQDKVEDKTPLSSLESLTFYVINGKERGCNLVIVYLYIEKTIWLSQMTGVSVRKNQRARKQLKRRDPCKNTQGVIMCERGRRYGQFDLAEWKDRKGRKHSRGSRNGRY